MGKFMKFGVVVAVMLCAAGAFASNFRIADQVYVPAAGHIASSRTFISSSTGISCAQRTPGFWTTTRPG